MEVQNDFANPHYDEDDRPEWMQYMTAMSSNDKSADVEPKDTSLSKSEYYAEDDGKPLWLRCLPSNKIIPRTDHKILVEQTEVDITERKKGWRRVVLRRSCNPFGPTSSHALTTENPILSTKRTRSDREAADGDEMQMESINDTDTIQKRVRYRRKPTANICEASELFAIVKL